MLSRKIFIFALCVLVLPATLCGCNSGEQASEAQGPLLTSRAPDKDWARDFDGNWDAFSPLLTERAPDKQWGQDFDPSWKFFQPSPQIKPRFSHSAPPGSPAATRRPALKGVVTLRTASDNFELFARDWLVKIGRSLRHTDANMDIASAHSGYVASFTKIATDSMQLKVKPSSSGSCSYIGVLKYEEHHFEGHGETHDKAQQGPFSRVGRLKVTEIFRFVAGRWVN